jgi:hypothetical protein
MVFDKGIMGPELEELKEICNELLPSEITRDSSSASLFDPSSAPTQEEEISGSNVEFLKSCVKEHFKQILINKDVCDENNITLFNKLIDRATLLEIRYTIENLASFPEFLDKLDGNSKDRIKKIIISKLEESNIINMLSEETPRAYRNSLVNILLQLSPIELDFMRKYQKTKLKEGNSLTPNAFYQVLDRAMFFSLIEKIREELRKGNTIEDNAEVINLRTRYNEIVTGKEFNLPVISSTLTWLANYPQVNNDGTIIHVTETNINKKINEMLPNDQSTSDGGSNLAEIVVTNKGWEANWAQSGAAVFNPEDDTKSPEDPLVEGNIDDIEQLLSQLVVAKENINGDDLKQALGGEYLELSIGPDGRIDTSKDTDVAFAETNNDSRIEDITMAKTLLMSGEGILQSFAPEIDVENLCKGIDAGNVQTILQGWDKCDFPGIITELTAKMGGTQTTAAAAPPGRGPQDSGHNR